MNVVKPEQLTGNQPNILWIAGDEPLLVNETADRFCQYWQAQGFNDRFPFQIEKGQPIWDDILQESGGMSLFATDKLIDLRFTQLPTEEDKKQLARILPLADEHLVFLIRTPAMNKKQTGAKWLKNLPGQLTQIWPLDKAKLPNWLAQRTKQAGFQLNPQALALLSERTEGNLLAAMQEIEKLKLLCEPGPITSDDLINLVANSSRHKPQDVIDAALQGNLDTVVRIHQDLIREGVAEPLLSWAIANDLRTLYLLSTQRLPHYLKPHFARSKHFDQAVRRLSSTRIETLLRMASKLDRLAKGVEQGDFQRASLTLLAKLASD